MITEGKSGTVFYRNGEGSVSTIVSGAGARVTDSSGREYIDAMGGVAVQIVGHGNETIARAIGDAAKGYAYSYTQNFTNPHQEALVERLTERLGFDPQSKYYFGSGGSDANEMAIKFAREYHLSRGDQQKYKVIRREHAYHGNTLGTLAVSDRPSWRQNYEPYYFPSPVVPGWLTARDLLRFDGDEGALTNYALRELERTIWSEGPRTISAIILEPVSGSSIAGAGLPAGYLEGVRELCDRHNILVISDEVFVGYGRLGLPRAMAGLGAEPDITTLGKGLGSGYTALSAVVLAPNVSEALGGDKAKHNQGYTFSGIPLACAVGVAVSDYVDEHKLFEQAARSGEILHSKLSDRLGSVKHVGDLRGRGMLAGIDLVQDQTSLTPFPQNFKVADRVAAACRDRGVIVSPGAPQVDDFRGGDQLHVAPPYIISEGDLDLIVEVIGDSVDDVLAQVT